MTTLRQSAWVAATSLLVMLVLSPIAYFGIFPSLVVRSDAVQTIHNIAGHSGLFLLAVLFYLLTFLADVLVAWALFIFLRPVHASLAMLTAWLRLIYATMALSSLPKLVTALRLVRGSAEASTMSPREVQAAVQLLLGSFRYEWGFAILVFAAHLGFLAVLVYRSRYIPRVLGVALAINSVAYVIDSLHPYLFPDVRLPLLFLAFFGELMFMLWLFVFGTRIAPGGIAP